MKQTAKKENNTIALKGDLVQIHRTILTKDQRSSDLPESTRANSYEGWIKGFLLGEKAIIGDTVRIETFIGRELEGTLAEINPAYTHDFGKPRPELLSIGKEEKERLQKIKRAIKRAGK